MVHTYEIQGVTCDSCVAKVENLLSNLAQVEDAKVQGKKKVEVKMNQHISIAALNRAFENYPKYKIIENGATKAEQFWNDTSTWKRAGANTLNCLIGCSIGDFGMIIYLQTYHHHMNMFLMMVLAMAAGLTTSVMLETAILKIKEGFDWSMAFKTAFGMSFLSMLAMELAENATDFMLTGGQISTSEPFYWIALAISMIAGFVVPLPYNYYKLKKHGKACH